MPRQVPETGGESGGVVRGSDGAVLGRQGRDDTGGPSQELHVSRGERDLTNSSVADPVCLSRIQGQRKPDPGSRTKN